MFKCHENLCFFDKDKQTKLNDKKVFVVGLGGLGSHAAMQLICSGITNIGLCDFDYVELVNISRQVYTNNQINQLKNVSLEFNLLQKNNNISISKFDKFNSEFIIDYDVVLDCTDNIQSRLEIYDACKIYNKFYIFGSSIGFEGQLLVNKCLKCTFPNFSKSNNSCIQNGVFSPVPSIIGTMQAIEAIKYLTGLDTLDHLLHIDFLSNSFNKINIPICKCPDDINKIKNIISIDLRDLDECDQNNISCPYGAIDDIIKIVNNYQSSSHTFRLICEKGNRSADLVSKLNNLGYLNIVI